MFQWKYSLLTTLSGAIRNAWHTIQKLYSGSNNVLHSSSLSKFPVYQGMLKRINFTRIADDDSDSDSDISFNSMYPDVEELSPGISRQKTRKTRISRVLQWFKYGSDSLTDSDKEVAAIMQPNFASGDECDCMTGDENSETSSGNFLKNKLVIRHKKRPSRLQPYTVSMSRKFKTLQSNGRKQNVLAYNNAPISNEEVQGESKNSQNQNKSVQTINKDLLIERKSERVQFLDSQDSSNNLHLRSRRRQAQFKRFAPYGIKTNRETKNN